MSNSSNEPLSSRSSMRSRAVSLPRLCWASMRLFAAAERAPRRAAVPACRGCLSWQPPAPPISAIVSRIGLQKPYHHILPSSPAKARDPVAPARMLRKNRGYWIPARAGMTAERLASPRSPLSTRPITKISYNCGFSLFTLKSSILLYMRYGACAAWLRIWPLVRYGMRPRFRWQRTRRPRSNVG